MEGLGGNALRSGISQEEFVKIAGFRIGDLERLVTEFLFLDVVMLVCLLIFMEEDMCPGGELVGYHLQWNTNIGIGLPPQLEFHRVDCLNGGVSLWTPPPLVIGQWMGAPLRHGWVK
ncbi:hypothetical protein BSKO_09389 [Bryopsis sp. KO-2023]|nr:hypothetical protein BSKO_09389 [Bryopsis sp. KO-2023]